MTGEQNLRLLEELDQNRSFLLLAYASNPKLLAQAEFRIRQLFASMPNPLPGPTQAPSAENVDGWQAAS